VLLGSRAAAYSCGVTRVTDDRPRKRRTTKPEYKAHQTDEAPTAIDGPKLRDFDKDEDADADDTGPDRTNVDGPRVEVMADPHDTVSSELDVEGGDDEGEDEVDDPTIYRGDKPPKPSSSRRLSPTLMRVFQRKREQIGLSIAQVAKLSGIDEQELMRFEATNGHHRLIYDHVVLLARVLGVRPQDLPGLRSSKLAKDAVGAALGSLTAALAAGPLLTFEGKTGERFGGDLERVGTTPHFAIKVGDSSLGEALPKGTMLALVVDTAPKPGDVVLVRHKRTKQLALRRATGQAWAPLVAWQPSYPAGGDWSPVARVQAILLRA
jgi:transcriptional regulator with XRE-family HTH domain